MARVAETVLYGGLAASIAAGCVVGIMRGITDDDDNDNIRHRASIESIVTDVVVNAVIFSSCYSFIFITSPLWIPIKIYDLYFYS